MGSKKAKASTPTADYTALNEQKLKEQEEADKYRREQAARRNNSSRKGQSILSWRGRNGK